MLELLKKLCSLNGVSGNEHEVREFIRGEVESCAESIEEDSMGNLVVFRRGRRRTAKKIMLCAHMDEVGIIITDITDDGYLRFAFAGGVDRRVVIGKQVYIGDNKIPGVVGSKAIHLTRRSEREKIPPLEDMYVDIGAGSKEEAASKILPGDTGAFSPDTFEFGTGFLKAKAIDDRIGCAALIQSIKKENEIDCTYVFTVQEEVGTRGAAIVSHRLNPDIALIVEGTTAADLPDVKAGKRICSPGNGVVIPFMDGGTIYNRDIYRLLTDICNKRGIKWQTKTYISGGTDARTIQRSRGGVAVGGIAAAVRNIHSPACIASIDDFNCIERLTDGFLCEMGAKYGI